MKPQGTNGAVLFVLFLMAIYIPFVVKEIGDKQERLEELRKEVERERKNREALSVYSRIVPMGRDEKVRMNLDPNLYTYELFVEKFTEKGTVIRIGKGNVVVLSQRPQPDMNRITLCGFKIKLETGLILNSTVDCVESVTQVEKGHFLVVEKAEDGATVSTFEGPTP